MKIVILGPVLWDSIWGHGQELTRILAKRHEVIYLEPVVHSSKLNLSFQRTAKNPVSGNVRVVKRNTTLGLNPLYGIYVELINVLYLKKMDYDIFITYYTTCGFLATVFSRLKRKKVILMYVDDLSEWYKLKVAKYVTKHVFTPLVAKFSDFVVTTAHKFNESIENYNKKVECIPNGVDLNFFRNKEKSFKKDNKFIVGFVGSFGTRIDYNLIIKTANMLREDKMIKFLFIGGGNGFEYLKSKVNELNLENVYLRESVIHSKVPNVINQMDVCLIPFKINRLTDCICPVKLFEYWALGKPVISTSFYEIKKIAEDKVIFVDSPEELKNAILKLKEDTDLRSKYGELGFNEVKNYDWNVMAERYLKLIEN
jgi:glycosyltransferase involved in cell wall biosynthesis